MTDDDDPGFSTAEILDMTGKTWDQWLRIVEAYAGDESSHAEVVAYLVDARGLKPACAELVAARFDHERDIAEREESPG